VTSLFSGAAVSYDVPLAPLTTLRVGPVARRLITCTTTEQVVAALGALRGEGVGAGGEDGGGKSGEPLVLGGGSNVVVDDTLQGLDHRHRQPDPR
jgi:UDP-N-acetylmuramate dehydrogenase